MKTKNKNTASKHHEEHVPVFQVVDKPQGRTGNVNPAQDQLSFFDIKELYDRAYEAVNEGRDDYKAKEMMAEAIKMDMAYRCQLSRNSTYQKHSQMNDFRVISDTV